MSLGHAVPSNAQQILWDDSDQTGVSGFAVTVDGVRTDYGRTPMITNGGCPCAVPFPLTTGTHTVMVSAYGPGGETSSAPMNVVWSGPTPPPTPPPTPSPTPPTPAPTPQPVGAPWTVADVGAVGMAGSATALNGVITVNGAGGDIWGTADAFDYVYQPVSGDGSIVARVTSELNTNQYAKAGLMWRQSLDAASTHVILDVRPDGSVEFMSRSAAGAATSYLSGTVVTFPAWLKLSRTGTTVTGYTSADGTTWTRVGAATIPAAAAWNAGLVVTSHVVGMLNTGTFDNVALTAATAPPAASLPSPWTDGDIGTTGLAGAASLSSAGAFSVNGSGADIWGSSDAFHYVSQAAAGDVTAVARVTALENTNVFAKAGIMLRESTSASSPNVVLDVRPDGTIEFMARATSGANTQYLAGAGQPVPTWLKLVRSGATVTGYVSANGSTWMTVGVTNTTMSSSSSIGLAVTSHDSSVLNHAAFDNVTVSTPASTPSPTSNVVVYAADIAASNRHGAWTTAADSTSPGGVKLTTADAGVVLPNAPAAAPADYVDVTFTAAANTPYRIWLRMKAGKNSKYNDSLWVQFSDALANGTPVYRIGSGSGLLVNLATDATASSLNGWGWQNGAYWLSQPTTVTFPTTGTHTLRIQTREDGADVDQIVLSPSAFLNTPPGPVSNDATIVPKQ